MRWLKTVCTIAGLNFRKWKSDCRVWVAFLLVLILIHSTTKQLGAVVAHTGVKSSPWIFPFLYMPYYNKLLFFFPLILIFSDAPFVDTNQFYVLYRSGRRKWCVGQARYIIGTSVLYFAFVALFSVVLNLGHIEFTKEWGKLFTTLAKTNMAQRYDLGFQPELTVLTYFTPASAMWFTFVHSVVCGVLLGFVIFLFNMKVRGGGTLLASLLLVLSAQAAKWDRLVKFSPVSWSTLNYIHLKPKDGLPAYGYVVAVYAGLAVVLLTLLLWTVRSYNFDREIKNE